MDHVSLDDKKHNVYVAFFSYEQEKDKHKALQDNNGLTDDDASVIVEKVTETEDKKNITISDVNQNNEKHEP